MLDVDIRHRQGDFDVEAAFTVDGGLTALFGPSGSGKTTIIQIVAGLLRPGEGRVRFGDSVWNDTARGVFVPPHRRGIGIVFQEGRLFPHMSVRDNLTYAGRFLASARTRQEEELARIAALLRLGALLDRRPQSLSGGEKQRVALGRALMARPRLLLMDEPLSALDEGIKAEILPDLERIRDVEAIPILYVSHSVDEITRLATRVVSIDRGRIAARTGMPAAESPVMADGHAVGSFIEATVTGDLADDDLTVARSKAGMLYLRRVALPPGARVRVHVPAAEVVIATGEVDGLSTLNRLPGIVHRLNDDGHQVEVTVLCSGLPVLARITRRSARALALSPGTPVHVLFKALSIAPESLFRPG